MIQRGHPSHPLRFPIDLNKKNKICDDARQIVANPKGGGGATYYLTNFPRKLHEDKESLIPRAPFSSPLA